MFKLMWVSLLLLISTSAWAETIQVYFYHHQPPFLIGDEKNKQGLVYDVVSLMNKNPKPGLTFEVSSRPRKRLNEELADWISAACPAKPQGCNNSWVVFWVTPMWGWGEKADQRYLWVDLFPDKDVIVSPISNKVEYKDASSLAGKTFAGLLGHKYPPDIEGLINEGKLKRDDGADEEAVMKRIALGRADVGMMQNSALEYYFAHNEKLAKLKNDVYVAPTPLHSFTLQVMIPGNRPDLQAFLKEMKQNSGWNPLFAKYDIKL